MHSRFIALAGGAALACALAAPLAPLAAQDAGKDPQAPDPFAGSVYDGDWFTIGAGAALSPSYDGSDDYVLSPLPLVQGRLGGISINPRPAGLALDFIPDGDGPVTLNLGLAGRLNRNRAAQIEDEVVRAYGELDTAVEVGPTLGLGISGVLHRFDSLTITTDVLWDVAGAHEGMTVSPSVTYFTPVSRGAALSFSLSARHVDDDYAGYYYTVPVPPAALPAAERLAPFAAEGGFDRVGATALLGFDFDGDLTNGGFAGFLIGGYSQLIGDAADTPFTAVRGSADQWLLGAGIGYTF
jgi:MipA family protein